MAAPHIPLRDAAENYWTTTLAPWLAQFGAELALHRPTDVCGFVRAAAVGSQQWQGLAAASDAFDETAAVPYQDTVVQPFLEGLAAAILQLDPLPAPAELGAAVGPLLAEQSPLDVATAEAVRQLEAATPSSLVNRMVARQTATALQGEALSGAAAAAAAHGGVGVETEPAVDAAAFEQYLKDHQV